MGCGKGDPKNATSGSGELRWSGTKEDWAKYRKEEIDINKDGRPDQVKYYDEEDRLVVATHDVNYDGKVDLIEYFENDVLIREEMDMDYDGQPDIIIRYSAEGKLIGKEFSTDFVTTLSGRIYFDDEGNIIFREVDTTSDGTLDTREYYKPNEDEPYRTEPIVEGEDHAYVLEQAKAEYAKFTKPHSPKEQKAVKSTSKTGNAPVNEPKVEKTVSKDAAEAKTENKTTPPQE